MQGAIIPATFTSYMDYMQDWGYGPMFPNGVAAAAMGVTAHQINKHRQGRNPSLVENQDYIRLYNQDDNTARLFYTIEGLYKLTQLVYNDTGSQQAASFQAEIEAWYQKASQQATVMDAQSKPHVPNPGGALSMLQSSPTQGYVESPRALGMAPTPTSIQSNPCFSPPSCLDPVAQLSNHLAPVVAGQVRQQLSAEIQSVAAGVGQIQRIQSQQPDHLAVQRETADMILKAQHQAAGYVTQGVQHAQKTQAHTAANMGSTTTTTIVTNQSGLGEWLATLDPVAFVWMLGLLGIVGFSTVSLIFWFVVLNSAPATRSYAPTYAPTSVD